MKNMYRTNRLLAMCATAFVLSACQPALAVAQQPVQQADSAKPLPSAPVKAKPQNTLAQAKKTLETAELCLHLAGEFGGDGSARDKEVTARQKQLQCDSVAEKLRKIKARLPKNSPLIEQIDDVLSSYE